MANTPIKEFRLGRLKAAIWKNEVGESIRYRTSFAKIYRLKESEIPAGDTGWRETQTYDREDLPLLAKVADMAHTWCYSQNARFDR